MQRQAAVKLAKIAREAIEADVQVVLNDSAPSGSAAYGLTVKDKACSFTLWDGRSAEMFIRGYALGKGLYIPLEELGDTAGVVVEPSPSFRGSSNGSTHTEPSREPEPASTPI